MQFDSPIGAFCNTIKLHQATACPKTQDKWVFFQFTFVLLHLCVSSIDKIPEKTTRFLFYIVFFCTKFSLKPTYLRTLNINTCTIQSGLTAQPTHNNSYRTRINYGRITIGVVKLVHFNPKQYCPLMENNVSIL